MIDDDLFNMIVSQINRLNSDYSNGSIRHFDWATRYDQVFENAKILKNEFMQEMHRRKGMLPRQISVTVPKFVKSPR